MNETPQDSPRPSPLSEIFNIIRNESFWRTIVLQGVAVLLAALIGAVILLLSGANPIQAYGALLKGSFGSMSVLARTLEKATPLVFAGLAVAFGFRGGLFNIGAQGQLLLGAITAAVVGFAVTGLPAIIHIPLALGAGALAGALYGAIPGALKTFRGAHEVIVTIMLNYIAINLTDYLADGPFKDNSPGNIVARTPEILDTARDPIDRRAAGRFLARNPGGNFHLVAVVEDDLWVRDPHRGLEPACGALRWHQSGADGYPDDGYFRIVSWPGWRSGNPGSGRPLPTRI